MVSIPPGDGAEAYGRNLRTDAVRIYEPMVGEAFDHLQHAADCVAVRFSHDGQVVVGGHDAGQVAAWDVRTGVEFANALTDAYVVGLVFIGRRDVAVATTNGVHVCRLPEPAAMS